MSLLLKVVYEDVTKTMKFNASDTVTEVVEKIHETIKKTQGSRPAPQGPHSIFYMHASVLCSPTSDDLPLSSLPLKNMDTIHFKKKIVPTGPVRKAPPGPLPVRPINRSDPSQSNTETTTTKPSGGGSDTEKEKEKENTQIANVEEDKLKEEREKQRLAEEVKLKEEAERLLKEQQKENAAKDDINKTLLSPRGQNAEKPSGSLSMIDRKPVELPSSHGPEETKGRSATYFPGMHTGRSSAGEVMFVVECPDLQFKKTMKVLLSSSLEDLLQNLVKRNMLTDPENFSFFLKDPKTQKPIMKLDRLLPISDLEIPAKSTLTLEKVQISLNIELHTGKMLSLVEQPDITVKEVLQRVVSIITKKETLEESQRFKLFLPNKSGAGGMILEPARKIVSYRLTKADVLQFKKKRDLPESAKRRRTTRLDTILSSEKSDEIYLTIECPSKGVKSTFQFNNTTTVGEIINTFAQKSKIIKPVDYFLVHTNEQGEEIQLENLYPIGRYKLRNLTKLNLKENTLPKVGTYVKPKNLDEHIFGVDPSTLEQIEDRGFKVPIHLVKLKNVIYEQNGIEGEGIFRLAGDELEMQNIKKELNAGTFTTCQDYNAAASLIKRWFGELPTRVFAALGDYFESCVQHPENCNTFPDHLDEPHKSLFLWLAELLLDVARKESVNKMGPGNLGVVVAPVLAHIPEGNPIASLIVTGQAVGVVEKYLNYRLEQEPK